MPSPELLGAATIGLSQGFAASQSFLPKLSEVRKTDASKNPEIIGDVRMGQIATAVITIGTGAIVSSLTGSPIPTYVAVVVVIGIAALYEVALRGDRPFDPRMPVMRSEVV